MSLKLNCDMGESFGIWKMGADEQIMPYIDMANLACGFHASDANTMSKSVSLAKKYGISIGAHPSYQDLVGFGRRSMNCSKKEIRQIVLYQIGALEAFCRVNGVFISYVKPHGALYNDMMKDIDIFKAIIEAINSYDKSIKLMILSTTKNQEFETIAKDYEIDLLFEVFADRNYNDDGTLVNRREKNAVISDEEFAVSRMVNLKNSGYLESISGKKLYIKADTICVHGDNEKALEFIKLLREALS